MDIREIEKKIAEKVMAWRVAYFPTINIYEAYDEEENPIIIGKDFSPARKIQDAWMVVEKLKTEKTYLNIFPDREGCAVDIWYEDDNGYYLPHTSIEAKTAPLAICLAVLRTVGVEVEVDG